MATDAAHRSSSSACSRPSRAARDDLSAGEVGFVIAGIKELRDAKVGDTVTQNCRTSRRAAPLPGFKEIQPQVFAGLYPTEANEYDALRDALTKLKLNDASLHYEPEVSQALGFGFRCGFLGLLHMEIVQERLEREFDQDLITTAPSVVYEVELNDGTVVSGREPVEDARPRPDRGDPRADRQRARLHAAGLRRPGDDAGQPQARHADQHGLPRPPGDPDLRDAAGRDRARLLRQAEVGVARLCVDGLRVQGVPRRRRRQGRHPDQRRQGRRAVDHRAPQPEPVPRPRRRRPRCAS